MSKFPVKHEKAMKKSIAGLKRDLTYWFNRYIRLRDLRKGCIACGKMMSFTSNWHAGHYYTKGSSWAALAYDETNVNGECVHCNTFLEGNKQGYAEGLVDRYGPDVLKRLKIKLVVSRGHRWDRIHYVVLIDDYREKCRRLEEKHGIAPAKKSAGKKKVGNRKKTDWKALYRKKKAFKPAGPIQF